MKISDLELTDLIKFLITALPKKDFEIIEIFVAERSKTNRYRHLNIVSFLKLRAKHSNTSIRYFNAIISAINWTGRMEDRYYGVIQTDAYTEYRYKGAILRDMTVQEFKNIPDSFLLKFNGVGKNCVRAIRNELNKY